MSTLKLPRWSITLLAAVPAFGLGVSVSAFASNSASPAAYYACLKGGSLSRVSTSAHRCPSSYKAVHWSEAGPQGLAGATGPQVHPGCRAHSKTWQR